MPHRQILQHIHEHPRRALVVQVLAVLSALCVAALGAGVVGAVTAGDKNAGLHLAPGEDLAAVTASFSEAQPGQCLNWSLHDDGSVSDFKIVDCGGEHRFEVTQRVNLATYPTSEFGENAPIPDHARQAALTTELCEAPTLAYLAGRFDPSGRYTISPILPPAQAWAHGDRTLLCGIQVTNDQGQAEAVTGKVEAQDQSLTYDPGTCVLVTESGEMQAVDCSQPHSFEVTSKVDVSQQYSDYPSAEVLTNYLGQTCTQAAIDYVGSDDALYNSTLEPFWTSLTEDNWKGGSHSVNCAVAKINTSSASFASLAGSVKDSSLSIDGKTVSTAGSTTASASATTSAAATTR